MMIIQRGRFEGKLNANANNIYLSGLNVSTGLINATQDLSINTTNKNGSIKINDDLSAGGNITLLSGNGINHVAGDIYRTGDTAGSINIDTTAGSINLLNVKNNNDVVANGGK